MIDIVECVGCNELYRSEEGVVVCEVCQGTVFVLHLASMPEEAK